MARPTLTTADRERAARLARRFQTKRGEERMSYEDLALASGVRYETVRAVLRGRVAGPSFFLVVDLAAALGLTLDDLVGEVR